MGDRHIEPRNRVWASVDSLCGFFVSLLFEPPDQELMLDLKSRGRPQLFAESD
jgi:hypothetical protein